MNLHLICSLFTQPGDVIIVEEPTYLYALRIFSDHGLKVTPIPTDQHGMRTELLEETIGGSAPKFIYTIPTYQNPSGCTLSAERRKQLVELCIRHNILLVADEVYHFLSYKEQPPLSFASEIENGKILSLGSFSKILAPGLRLGWMQANPEILTRFNTCGVLDSGGGLNPFTSAIVCRMVESGGLDQNIDRLVSIYRHRLGVLDAALRKQLPGLNTPVRRAVISFGSVCQGG